MYRPNKKEQNTLKNIEGKYYMSPSIRLIKIELSKRRNDEKRAWKEIFDSLHNFIRDAQDDVHKLLEERKERGEIKNIRQASVSIVGNIFSSLVIYVFIQNKLYGNIREDIYITSKPSGVRKFREVTTIRVGEETQKPDVDLVIYTEKDNGDVKKCIILSLKTSLRERAGQTYKWKLLMEIATTENSIKNKYNIEYNPENMPLVCFATVNFYDEINTPQNRGMFKFFDSSFIGKRVNSKFVKPLSYLTEYVNEKL